MSESGYIYVLINHSMIDLVKVGKTAREPEERAKELSSVTGIPTPFIVAFDAYFDDCSQAEDYVHRKLEQKGYRRLSNNREFFQAPLKEAIDVIIETQQIFKSQQIMNADVTQTIRSKSETPLEVHIEQGEPWSEVEALAHYYCNVGNYEEGFRLFKKALSLGSKNSYHSLGRMTMKGLGCIEDEKEALDYLRKGVDSGAGLCCAELAEYYFRKNNPKIGKEWFEKYLQSDSFSTYDILRSRYVFNSCVWIDMLGKFQRYEIRNSDDILLKYKDILSPFKEEFVSYAIECMKQVKDSPGLKPYYLKVAQNIKKNI